MRRCSGGHYETSHAARRVFVDEAVGGSGAITFYLFCRSVFRFYFLIYFKRGGAVWRVVLT